MQPDWLHLLPHCPSTNQVALDRLDQLQHGSAIFTRQQTAGRGQRNRVWQSPPGVITVSFVVHDLSSFHRSYLNWIAGWTVLSTLDQILPPLGPQVLLKWPNDLLIADRKVAGILCEQRSTQPNSTVIGIGLNHQVAMTDLRLDSPSSSGLPPISLHEICKTIPDDVTIVTQLRQSLLQTLSQTQTVDSLMNRIRSRNALYDRRIQFELPDGQTIIGLAQGISDRGELWIEQADHTRQPYRDGRITHLFPHSA